MPVRFILKTLFFAAGTAVIVSLAPALRVPVRALSLHYFIAPLSSRGGVIFFAALFLALISSHFGIIRRSGIRLLSLCLLFVSAFSLLYLGLYVFGKYPPVRLRLPESSSLPLAEDVMHRSGEVYFWIGDTRSVPAGPVLLLDRGKGRGGFHLYPEAVYNPGAETLRLLSTGAEVSLRNPGDSRPPAFLRALILDLSYLTEQATPGTLIDPPAGLFVFSLIFFGISLWTLARLSRWPLFNMWILLGTVWIVFSGIRLMAVEMAPEVLRIEGLEWTAAFLPLIPPGVCGLVLFLGALIAQPMKEWKRDMRYD